VKDSKWYVEVSDGVKRKTPPEMIKVSELSKWQAKHQSSVQGLFSSIYVYSTDDPYIGGVLSDFYMDFDSEENPNKARKEAISVVKKFIQDYGIREGSTGIAFSGMKGISLTVDYRVFKAESSADLPLIWKSIVQELIKKSKLKTADTSVYERRRLWRLLNSRHQKSGLYKIPLTLTELENLSIDKIKQKADKPRKLTIKGEARPVSKAEKLFERHKNKVEKWLEERKKTFEKVELRTFTDDPPCVKRRLEIGAKVGSRNSFLFRLAVYYANKGLSEPEIAKIGYEFAKRCEQEPETFPKSGEVESIVNSAIKGVQDKRYSVGCSSEAFADLCDKENCPLFNPEQKMWADIGEPITFEEWHKTIMKNFPHLWSYAEVCASTVAVLLIEDTQPVALVLQGVPGSGKTTTLNFFKSFPHSHATDRFTPKSFVTHVAQKKPKELKKIDLLPRIKDKTLITPDLNTIFGAKADELKETFSILTRVLDGQGLVTDSGVYGTRGYRGDYMFTWIGATTPIPHSVWDLFGNLGARMYFMYVSKKYKSKNDRIKEIKDKPYKTRLNECNKATLQFLKGIWSKKKVEWNRQNEPKKVLGRIIDLADLLVRLRGKVNVAVKEQYGDKTYWSEPIIEEPERAIEALYALARGHALIKGRTQITVNDLPVAIDVALSSAPYNRVITFAYLLNKEKVTTKELMEDLKCSRSTAIRKMKTLELLELVDLQKKPVQTMGGEQSSYTMKLKEKFKWFTTGEFKKLWRLKLTDIIKTEEVEEEPETEEKPKTLESFETMFPRSRKTMLRRWVYRKTG
jgi:predicted transcriptional regulator